MSSVPLADIVVAERHRTEMGDINGLAASIRRVGLLQPLVVVPNTPGFRLVAGARRLAAIRQLGWDRVPVAVATSIADAAGLLQAERDENTCRKDFTPSEAVALGKALEAIERPRALARKQAAGHNHGRGMTPIARGESPPANGASGKTRDIVAPAVGMKPSRYAHAKSVVDAAENEDDPRVREIAQEAVREMDETGHVETAYRKVLAARDREEQPAPPSAPPSNSREAVRDRERQVREMAASGHTSHQIARALGVTQNAVKKMADRTGVDLHADESVGRSRHIDANRFMDQTVLDLDAHAASLHLMDGRWTDLDPSRVEEWATSLTNSLRSLNRFCKQLKEMTHA